MRSSKLLCLALGALNLIVFLASYAPKSDTGLEARLGREPRAALPDRSTGSPIPFRIAGDYPELHTAPTPEPPPIAAPEESVDAASISFLGSMSSPEGRTVYFFKDKATNRMYSSGGEDGGAAILSVSEKELLIEIDGRKYKVPR